MKPEQKIQKQIQDYLSSIDAYYFKVISATKKGIPDITACIKGRFIFIEVKAKKEEASPLQLYNLREAHKAGGIAFVAWNVEMVEEIFRLEGLI